MSEDDYWIRLAGVKQKRALIAKGVRHDPVQKGFMPGEEPDGVQQPKYYGKKKRRRKKF